MRNSNMMNSMKRVAVVAVAASALLATTSGAQSAVGPRWQAWLGCWTAAQPGGQFTATPASAPTVCVTPTADANVVNISTISDGKIVTHDRVDASGRETPIEAKNCTGLQKAQFSSDERRVYLKAATNCEGLKSATSAILAMTAQGDWIDVRNVNAYGDDNVRVARYRDAGMPSSIPSDIANALNGRSMVSQSARIAAGAPVGTNAVIEATRQADSAVVAAWLLERGQRFSLGADELVSLADAGVPAAVTDAMIAVSNPGAFGVARADRRGNSVDDDDYPANRRRQVYMDPFYDPYGYGYSRYGYNGYGYGSYYGGGYYGGYNGGYYGSPIIVVTGPGVVTPAGQMVKGRGYTQNSPSSTGDRQSSQRERADSPSSSNSGSSSSSSGSSAAASSKPASEPAPTRTAHPKP